MGGWGGGALIQICWGKLKPVYMLMGTDTDIVFRREWYTFHNAFHFADKPCISLITNTVGYVPLSTGWIYLRALAPQTGLVLLYL